MNSSMNGFKVLTSIFKGSIKRIFLLLKSIKDITSHGFLVKFVVTIIKRQNVSFSLST